MNEERLRERAQELGIPYLTDNNFVFDPAVVKNIPVSIARKLKIIPLFLVEEHLSVAMTQPDNLEVIDEIVRITGYEIYPVLISDDMADLFISQAYGFDSEIITDYSDHIPSGALNSIEVLNILLEKAIFHNASDIHLEKQGEKVRVRFRIDGNMIEIRPYPASLHDEIISRIKVICGLDIAEKRLPQEGKFYWEKAEREIDLRIVVLPTTQGETAVIRILDPINISKKLEFLGFDNAFLDRYRNSIHKNQGLILICGPTGSGKTTTLYTTIQELPLEEKKLITVEDPCEYQLGGISQLEVNDDIGFTYLAGLKSILRADPDIIMIGEIRDAETARIALEASMTGHLVFSTLHTTSSISAVYRLMEMGLPPFMIVDSLHLIITQRLVKKLCPHCMTEGSMAEAKEAGDLSRLGLSIDRYYISQGCLRCRNTGFSGRTLIYEVLNMSSGIRKMILSGAVESDIREQALKEDYVTINTNAGTKIQNGEISLADTLANLREA